MAVAVTCIAVVVRVLYEYELFDEMYACIGQMVGWRIARKHLKHCLLFNMWCAEDDRLSSCCGSVPHDREVIRRDKIPA